MASAWIRGSMEATKIAAEEAAGASGRLVRDVGGGLLHRVQPGYIPPWIVAQQAVLRQFEGRFGVVDLDDPEKDPEVEAYMAADAMVDQGDVDQYTAVELRLALPEDLLQDYMLDKHRRRVLEILQLAFEEDHNIMALPNTDPIVPSQHARSRVGPAATWQAFAPQLDGLRHQFSGEGFEPAMLTVTPPAYERAMFGGHAAISGSPHGSNLLALEAVGRRPEDNELAWLRPSTPLAA